MNERPIIFNSPMVRAILAGTKTQTRRAVKPQPAADLGYMMGYSQQYAIQCGEDWPDDARDRVRCPYGAPGDRLWVRETWGHWGMIEPESDCIIYRADADQSGIVWHSSIHMPRWASRILLEVVAVRVERVQDISEADALAEGMLLEEKWTPDLRYPARAAYAKLWDEINAKRGYPWAANPWVWVVEFKRLEVRP